MPGFESGRLGAAEKEWGQEIGGEKDYQEKWEDAEYILRKFLDEFNASTSFIPLEDYDHYLEAAKHYHEIAQKHPGDVNKKLLMMAENIIDEAPIESSVE